MPALSDSQMKIIGALIDTAPDSAIRSLDLALAAEPAGGPMGEIRDLVSAEAQDRRARNIAFAPLTALCPRAPIPGLRAFPSRTIVLLWRALKADMPDQVSLAVAESMQWDPESDSPATFDNLCTAAARGLRSGGSGPFGDATRLLDEHEPDGAHAFAAYLDLAPLARQAIRRLPGWVSQMTGERAAAIRLAYRDATTLEPDAGVKLIEMLAAQLDEPWQILRVVVAIHDKPSDVFLKGSELCGLCERLLDQIDQCIEAVNGFDPNGGKAAGGAASEALTRAVHIFTEFDQQLDLKKDGPWGTRILKQKTALGRKVETTLKKADDAVAAALPVKPVKFGKGVRGMPNFARGPDPEAVVRAEAMMAFVERTRAAAQAGGYASLRSKVIERLDDRFDHYVDDVLDNLRADAPEEPLRAQTFLEIAASLVGLYRDEKAAQIVRRRAAA